MPEWTEETGFAEARRRIATCAEAHSDTLDLGGLRLTRLPEELRELTWLKSLDLPNNRVGPVGVNTVARLTSLTSLDLEGNRIGAEGVKALAALNQSHQPESSKQLR